MEHDRERLNWHSIANALTSRTSIVVLLEGDAGRRLSAWRAEATRSGTQWLEASTSGDQSPFALWTRLAMSHPAGANLAMRLRFGPPQPVDPDCPVLPDPLAVFDAISTWIAGIATRPLVVVLDAVDRADRDCLLALSFVARSLENASLALVLVTSGQHVGPQWDNVVRQLTEEAGLIRMAGVPHPESRPQRPLAGANSVQHGIAHCRAGALHTGCLALTSMLETATGNESALSAVDEAQAWQYLAMATLNLREFATAQLAAARVMALGDAPGMRRLARRIRMSALHDQRRAAELRALGNEAWRELGEENLSATEAAWLQLDAALGFSLDDSDGRHDLLLEDLLTRPEGEVTAQCRSVAHVWLAASCLLRGNAGQAAAYQRTGLALLVSLDDFSRVMFLRVRHAAVLFALERYAEASCQFEEAARQGLRAGRFSLAAESLAYAARARAATGDLAAARRILAGPGKNRHHVWGSMRARLLLRHAEAVVALASGDLSTAEALANLVLADLESHLSDRPSLSVGLACECAFVLADIAAAAGDTHRAKDWIDRGLTVARTAAPEEGAALLMTGGRRRAKLVSTMGEY